MNHDVQQKKLKQIKLQLSFQYASSQDQNYTVETFSEQEDRSGNMC